jgi:hypothetical protein
MAVEGYSGRPGAGKTCTMVARAFAAKKRGRRVFANIPLVDNRLVAEREYFFFGNKSIVPANARTYGRSWSDGQLNSLAEVMELDNALILLDEVHLWVPSTEWKSIPLDFRMFLAQQRKDGIDIWWTAQHEARVFNVIRELTWILWRCERYGPVSYMRGKDPESGEDYGSRYVWMGPDVWGLYDTTFKVGDVDGHIVGRSGLTERYRQVARAHNMELVEWVVRRYEFAGGFVRYRRERFKGGDVDGDVVNPAGGGADGGAVGQADWPPAPFAGGSGGSPGTHAPRARPAQSIASRPGGAAGGVTKQRGCDG